MGGGRARSGRVGAAFGSTLENFRPLKVRLSSADLASGSGVAPFPAPRTAHRPPPTHRGRRSLLFGGPDLAGGGVDDSGGEATVP